MKRQYKTGAVVLLDPISFELLHRCKNIAQAGKLLKVSRQYAHQALRHGYLCHGALIMYVDVYEKSFAQESSDAATAQTS